MEVHVISLLLFRILFGSCSLLLTVLNLFNISLRSNLVGTRFTVFNNGVNPKKGGVMSDGSNIREEVAAIIYVSVIINCINESDRQFLGY